MAKTQSHTVVGTGKYSYPEFGKYLHPEFGKYSQPEFGKTSGAEFVKYSNTKFGKYSHPEVGKTSDTECPNPWPLWTGTHGDVMENHAPWALFKNPTPIQVASLIGDECMNQAGQLHT